VREVRRERVRLVVAGELEERVLAAPACVLDLFTLGPGGEPVRATPSREALEAVATDPGSYWIPNPAGAWSMLARRGRPPGTAGWHCLLAASEAGGSPLQLRLLWSAGSLLAALRDLESVPEAKPGRAARARASGAAMLPGPPRAVVLPGPRRSGVELRGVRRWGAEEEVAAVRRAHPVRGHLRRLEGGRKASEAARKAAGKYGIVLPDGRTFLSRA
jgi:hypothetical protein